MSAVGRWNSPDFRARRAGRAAAAVFLASSLIQPPPALASIGSLPAVEACFVPGEDCAGLIVREIAAARASVRVLAYSFTSKPVAAALVDAKKRGLRVEMVLDHSNRSDRYSSLTFVRNAGIAVRVDDTVAIAHNKVIVIDDATVVTGSFNFTASAQSRNAENVLVLRRDPALAKRYADYFRARWAVSKED